MMNLTRYIQCHPSVRYLRLRHKKTLIVVFIGFLIFFMTMEKLLGTGSSTKESWTHDDQIVALKSYVGYLKHKIAKYSITSGSSSIIPDLFSLPMIYVITPTYARPVQKAELTRLCHTFLLVPNLHWILVEDAKVKTSMVTNLLRKCGVSYTHLNAQTPPDWKLKSNEKSWRKPRGVIQRNEGLHWIRGNLDHNTDGVIYFADDDNTYSLDLFEEMRFTSGVSVWPVGLVGGLMVEKPKLSVETGKVIGWDVNWAPQRPFALDMAGFAVNVRLFLSRNKAKFAYDVKRGHQESVFLAHLVRDLSELEPRADRCTKVLVWHTRSEKVKLDMEKKREEQLMQPSNLEVEV